jgi:hypothetical protein
MKKNNFVERIEKIYDLLGRGHAMNTEELYQLMKEPKGTVSPFLSWMVRTGNLLKTNDGYMVTAFQNEPQKVARDIRNLIAKDRENRINKAKAYRYSRGLFDQPKKPEPITLNFDRVDSEAIEAAIDLLKSNGYKILKPTTEFKEI